MTRFYRLRRGNPSLSPEEAERDPAYLGLKTFVRKGQCVICHKGVTMTDDLFHNIGVKDSTPGAPGHSARPC